MRDDPETEWSMELHDRGIPSYSQLLSSQETAEREKIFKECARVVTVRGREIACLSPDAFVCCKAQKRDGLVSPGMMLYPRNQQVRRQFDVILQSIRPVLVAEGLFWTTRHHRQPPPPSSNTLVTLVPVQHRHARALPRREWHRTPWDRVGCPLAP